MGTHAKARLESLLRARQLDRTLVAAAPLQSAPDALAVAATDLAPLDALLEGGFPRGQLSELVGRRSTGRTSVLLRMLAAATARGEAAALVDALDMLDVASAWAAGVDVDRLLWIRGFVMTNPGLCRDMNQRAVEQALKALSLVLQAGHFGLVVLDLAEAPRDALRRLPFTTWLRLQRIIEGSQTACVLAGSESMARSTAGLTLRLGDPGLTAEGSRLTGPEPGTRDQAPRTRFRGPLFDGLEITASVVRARAHAHQGAAVALSTVASAYV